MAGATQTRRQLLSFVVQTKTAHFINKPKERNQVENKNTLLAKRRKLEAEIKTINAAIAKIDEVESGNVPAPEIAALIAKQKFSYGVEFVRKNGKVVVSQRRFSSSKEAKQHGTRFTAKHAHKDFAVVRINKRANAWINWKTGKTNPVI